MAGRRMTQAFQHFPLELFRISYSRTTHLRDYGPENMRKYDVITKNGIVQPKALQPAIYRGPNGASMRPNTAYQQILVRYLKGDKAVVYVVPAGTTLPSTLMLVHESRDHFSLQGSTEMTLDELNREITLFLEHAADALSKEQWMRAYPKQTLTDYLKAIP